MNASVFARRDNGFDLLPQPTRPSRTRSARSGCSTYSVFLADQATAADYTALSVLNQR